MGHFVFEVIIIVVLDVEPRQASMNVLVTATAREPEVVPQFRIVEPIGDLICRDRVTSALLRRRVQTTDEIRVREADWTRGVVTMMKIEILIVTTEDTRTTEPITHDRRKVSAVRLRVLSLSPLPHTRLLALVLLSFLDR